MQVSYSLVDRVALGLGILALSATNLGATGLKLRAEAYKHDWLEEAESIITRHKNDALAAAQKWKTYFASHNINVKDIEMSEDNKKFTKIGNHGDQLYIKLPYDYRTYHQSTRR